MDAFTQHMDFGGMGTAEVSEFRVEGSEESRRLLEGMGGPGQIQYQTQVETLDRPIRCQLQVRRKAGGPVVRTLDVPLRRQTAGARGLTLMGEDETGTLELTLRLPRAPKGDGPVVVKDAGLTLNFKPMDGIDADLAIGVLEFRHAAQAGLYLTPNLKGFKTDGIRLEEPLGAGLGDVLDVARVLDRLGTLLGAGPFPMPGDVSERDYLMALALADSLEGKPGVTPLTSFSANINPARNATSSSGSMKPGRCPSTWSTATGRSTSARHGFRQVRSVSMRHRWP